MTDKVEKKVSLENADLTPDLSSEKKDLTTLQTNVDTDILKGSVEDDSTEELMLTYIKGSVMETKLNDLESSGKIPNFTVEKFAKNINTTVETYLEEVFKISGTETLTIKDSVVSSMSIGIQFAMMDALTKSGAKGAKFFSTFSETDTNDASSTFTNLTKAFGSGGFLKKFLGGVGKTNEFYSLAQKVESCVSYISRYCGEGKDLGDGTKVEKLANANEFRKLLANTTWGNDTLLLSKTPEDMGLALSDTTIPEMSATDKADLKKIVDNDKMPINKKTIEAIMKALPTAQRFLEKRAGYKSQAIDLMATVSGFLDVDVFGFGSLGSIIGITSPMDLFRGKDGEKKGGIVNFVLKAMGFHNGVEGLYQEYLRQTIDQNITDDGKQFISDTLADYTTITAGTYTGTTTVDGFGLTTLDATLQAKIPSQYDDVKTTLYENISGKELSLNPDVLISLGLSVETKEDADGHKILDKDTFDKTLITEDVMDEYLKLTIPTLAANTDFMTGITTPEQFVLALAGGLVCGTCFAPGVALGLETLNKYTDKDVGVVNETIDETDPELVKLAAGPDENYGDNSKFKQYLHTLEAKKGLAYGIMLNLMIAESGGELYQTDGKTITGSSAGAQGLFQFMPDTAKEWITQIQKDATTYYTEADYEIIFTNPIVGAKACALFLKKRLDAGDDTVNMLAHYNAGSGVIASAKITIDNFSNLPTETQKYVTKIGYAMLKYAGESTIITEAQFATPSSITEAKLESFLAAVNALPVSSVTTPVEADETLTQENYKTNTMFVGDSLTVGYAAYPEVNGVKHAEISGYRSLGSVMGGKRTGWMDEHFDEATDATPTPENIIVLGGVNDLCNYALKNITTGATTYDAQTIAKDILKNLTSMSDKAKAKGIKFIVGTILPFDGFLEKQTYASEQTVVHDAMKLVNDTIKTTRPDNYIDFNTEFTDTIKPGHLPTLYDGGDGVHLSVAGYKKMQELAFAKRKEVNAATTNIT